MDAQVLLDTAIQLGLPDHLFTEGQLGFIIKRLAGMTERPQDEREREERRKAALMERSSFGIKTAEMMRLEMEDSEMEANKGKVLYRHDFFFIWRQMDEAKKLNADMAKKKAKEMASGVAYQNGQMA